MSPSRKRGSDSRLRGNDDGVALALAITGALVVSLTAAVVLSFTYRRFQLSMRQADRMAAFYASEAGTQYAWVRLSRDDTRRLLLTDGSENPSDGGPGRTFSQRVAAKAPNPLVVTSDVNAAAGTYDHYEQNLRMGSKNVTVRITFDAGGRHKVNAVSDYQS